MKRSMKIPRVAVLVVGNEVLSGDVAESNASFLAAELHRLGAAVDRILVVPDEEETIAAELRRLSKGRDAVVVTGGIGATHDDVTRQAVARAFDLPLAVNRRALAAIRARYGPSRNRARRELANLPSHCRLIPNRIGAAPGFIVANAYVFPGVPAMLREMFPLVAAEFSGPPIITASIFTTLPESAFAGPLARIAAENPRAAIGSYPLPPGGRHRVRLSIKSRNAGILRLVKGKVERMLARLADSRG